MPDYQNDPFSIPTHFASLKEAAEFWRLCKEYWDVVEELEFEVHSPYFCESADLTGPEPPELDKNNPKPAKKI